MSELHLFEAYGIEIEIMLVDATTLAVAPICDRVLEAEAGEPTCELRTESIGWSNELAAHVIELKTAGPAPAIDDALASAFATDLRKVDAHARTQGARVLTTAMHPTMDPRRESVLWPHEGRDIYGTYDAVFGCEGHGWTNLQSCHLNLPFCGAEEFGALHAAVRAVLPILPALAASSPFVEGRFDGVLDRRLQVYMHNQKRVPSVIGDVIPEPVYTPSAYAEQVLAPMYADIAPLDPHGELQHEWLNSRGAIARFDRSAIEIRVLDAQESPWADMAQARLVAGVVEALTRARWVDLPTLQELPTRPLREVFERTVRDGERASIEYGPLLVALGLPARPIGANELWWHLLECCGPAESAPGLDAALRTRMDHGSLATRILRATGENPSVAALREVYAAVADCALADALFVP